MITHKTLGHIVLTPTLVVVHGLGNLDEHTFASLFILSPSLLIFSHFLIKFVGVINVSILCVN